jgi:mannosyl-oligosaccharide alpha-1,3-glucosidase
MVRRERARRSTAAQQKDPFTVVVALDSAGKASGELYLDDGETFAFEQGQYIAANITYDSGVLRYTPTHSSMPSALHFERIVILGLDTTAGQLQVVHEETKVKLVAGQAPLHLAGSGLHAFAVRKASLPVDKAWSVRLQAV